MLLNSHAPLSSLQTGGGSGPAHWLSRGLATTCVKGTWQALSEREPHRHHHGIHAPGRTGPLNWGPDSILLTSLCSEDPARLGLDKYFLNE